MVYREYLGDYQGIKLNALVGYAVKGKYGYAIVGLHAKSDRRMEKMIYQSMKPFRRN